MNELTQVVLEADPEPVLPMDVVGWGALVLGVLVTIVWLIYLYR